MEAGANHTFGQISWAKTQDTIHALEAFALISYTNALVADRE